MTSEWVCPLSMISDWSALTYYVFFILIMRSDCSQTESLSLRMMSDCSVDTDVDQMTLRVSHITERTRYTLQCTAGGACKWTKCRSAHSLAYVNTSNTGEQRITRPASPRSRGWMRAILDDEVLNISHIPMCLTHRRMTCDHKASKPVVPPVGPHEPKHERLWPRRRTQCIDVKPQVITCCTVKNNRWSTTKLSMTLSRESHVFRSGKMLSYEPRKSFMSLDSAYQHTHMLHGH